MTFMTRVITIVLAAFALSAPVQAEHLAPRNECAKLTGASDFVRTLTTAVANRNAEMLRGIVDENIVLDFGGGSGWNEMQGRLLSPDYNLWAELDAVLRLGCGAYDDGSIAMPLYWVKPMPDGYESYGTYIVTGSKVPLYSAQTAGAVFTHLDWEAVELVAYLESVELGEDPALVEIRRADGTRGFADRALLRSLVDYRLLAAAEDGAWRITHFIAGD
ncbi:hypothetical protein INR77_06965 [Erythrobacter sp. SCSIO 43205]|uniref:hypothetical protein n=1 Tax=Erythrobacter sp. SCSIO 43205 TaxID=2779361 RepID=UPI001CA9C001|nr:hypothetical protein [Erythrobacter sp. SCSIO 43205]UAB79405.1 hypothetical protein INR77_06965 [Erythrobacter sp. SCSIO 43205]